jgi:hypothetical protein
VGDMGGVGWTLGMAGIMEGDVCGVVDGDVEDDVGSDGVGVFDVGFALEEEGREDVDLDNIAP